MVITIRPRGRMHPHGDVSIANQWLRQGGRLQRGVTISQSESSEVAKSIGSQRSLASVYDSRKPSERRQQARTPSLGFARPAIPVCQHRAMTRVLWPPESDCANWTGFFVLSKYCLGQGGSTPC